MLVHKVLIVDDEPGMRLGAEKSLRKFHFCPENFDEEIHFEIFLAEDGRQAIELLEQIAEVVEYLGFG